MENQEVKQITWENITCKDIENMFPGDYQIIEAIEWARKFITEPVSVGQGRPVLAKNSSSIEVRIYAEELEEWENKQSILKEKKIVYQKSSFNVYRAIKDYIIEMSGLNNLSISKQAKEKAYSIAWEHGHSDGYHSVYYNLTTLVGLLELCQS